MLKKPYNRNAFVLVLLFFSSCMYYEPRLIRVDDLRDNHIRSLDPTKQKFYLQDGQGIYVLKEVNLSDSFISGIPEQLVGYKEMSHITNPKPKDARLNKNAVQLFLTKDIHPVSAAVGKGNLIEEENGRFRVNLSDIQKVQVFKVNKKKTFENILLWVLLGVFGVILLTYLLLSLVVLASGQISGESTKASGESNSGSGNSGSGNSGNSNSNSGGSNSGCYIATMVYGSYDAPEVLVLRRFRDEVLASSKAGRGFIKVYYYTSPTFVRYCKGLKPVHYFIRIALNNLVKTLSGK